MRGLGVESTLGEREGDCGLLEEGARRNLRPSFTKAQVLALP